MLALTIAGVILIVIGAIWNYIANRKFKENFRQHGWVTLMFAWDAFIPVVIMLIGSLLILAALGWAGVAWLAAHVTFS